MTTQQIEHQNRPVSVSWPLVALVAGWLVVLAEAAATVAFAPTIYDEGGYLYEGWLVCARGWRPYQDFHTKVTPLLYYFYGLPQALFGPDLLLGRVQAAATALTALALGSLAAEKTCGLRAAALVPWLFAATVAGLDQHFRALAISPCALWTALALVGIAWSDRKWGPWLTGAGAGLLLLTRHDLVGLAAGLLFGAWLAGRGSGLLKSVAGAAVVFAVGLAPFLARAPQAVLNVLTLGKVPGSAVPGPRPFARTEPLTLGNLPWYVKFLARAYFSPGLSLIAAACLGLAKRRPSGPNSLSRNAVAGAGLAAAAGNLAVRGMATALTGSNAFYLRDFYIELPLLVSGAAFFARAYEALSEANQRRAAAAVAVLAIVLGPLVFKPHTGFRAQYPPVPAAVAEAGRFIAAHTQPDDRIFTIADPHVFLAAGRTLLPHLTHHMFMYAPQATREQLKGSWCFNLETLMDMLRNHATVAVLTERGMGWLEHNERTSIGQQVGAAIRAELKRRWQLVASSQSPFEGRIEIYRRTR
ncbi:MAG: hypothetical protein H5T86_04670 [Armatimonadetes bacterium]|nr:hypothetical protein [Armatimonadota bacterium]